jgi:NAD(P)-dependent dehydrogenase (short-subunit alcohol dehydrogenase family)
MRKERGNAMELQDQIAIVTGAGRGIGEAVALTFAREGASVVVNDINFDDAKKVADKIMSMGRKALPFKASVANKIEVQSMVKECLNQFGTVDILVNNAGISGSLAAEIKNISEETWDNVLAVNLKGVFLCCQAVVPIMVENRKGKIVNVASLAARRMGYLTGADYTASKGGIVAFSHHLAHEVAIHGINVNVINPGSTLTAMNVEHTTQDFRNVMAERLPLGKWCMPQDLAEAVLFLVSKRSNMITGVQLDVDAGQQLGWGNYREDKERRRKVSGGIYE